MNNYLKSLSANAISTIWTLIFQLISVPIFLTFWGNEKYGEWLVLNSLVVFFSMSDIGINTASLNSFVINYHNSNFLLCKKIFLNNLILIVLTFTIVLLVLMGLFHMSFFVRLFNFKIIANEKIDYFLLILFFYTFIGTLSNSLNLIYSATEKYSRGVMLDNLFKILEGFVLVILIIRNVNVLFVLLSYLFVKIIHLLYKFIDSKRFYNIDLALENFDLLELKKILLPSLSFFSIPIANTFIYQGFTLGINYFFGSSKVVTYNTTRTLVNLIKSVSDIITRSFWPNISIAYAKKNLKLVRLYHSRVVFYSIVIFSAALLFFICFSKIFYLHWTRGITQFDTILVYLLLLSMFFNLLQSSGNLILQSTNQHNKFVLQYFVYNLIGLFIAMIIAKYTERISLVPIGLLFTEISLFNYVYRTTLNVTDDCTKSFIKRLRFDLNYHLNYFKKI